MNDNQNDSKFITTVSRLEIIQVLKSLEFSVDMEGDEVIEKGTILIEKNIIKAIGPSSSVVIPKEAKIIDAKGKTDSQIKQEIQDKLRAKGIENPDITITTQPDGKREIKIEAKDEKKIDR